MSVADTLPADEKDLPPHLQQQRKPQVEPATSSSQTPDVDSAMSDAPASPVASSSALPAAEGSASHSRSIDPAMPPPAALQGPTTDELALAASRKRAASASADESKKRGRRMLGLLTSTLKQAKGAAEAPKSGAAKKREELEIKLAEKVRREREEGERKARVDRERRDLKATVNRIEDSLANADSIFQNRHSAKLHLAGFLCTTFNLPAPPPKQDDIPAPFAPRLPHAMRMPPHHAKSIKPVYYLPFKLLPAQEDQVDDQIAAVRKAIRHEKEDAELIRERKLKDLAEAREQLAQLNSSVSSSRKARESTSERAAEEGEVTMRDAKERSAEPRSAKEGSMSQEPSSAKEGSMDVDAEAPLRAKEETPAAGGGGEDVAMVAVAGGEEELEY